MGTRQAINYHVTLRCLDATIVGVEKQKYYILCVCVCLCGLRYPACNAHILPHYLTIGTIFEKKIIKHKMRFDFLYNFCLKYFSFKRNWARYNKKCKVCVIVVRFSLNLTCLHEFSKNTLIPNFVKIRPLILELFHAEGRTDIRTDLTKLVTARSNPNAAESG
jgi:hypothetical protein